MLDEECTSNACRFCGGDRHLFSTALVLGRIPVSYYKCAICGGIQTQDPNWLEEAYSSPITSLDVGLVNRCIWSSNIVEAFLSLLGTTGPHLDWAGGYGLLTRMLRDRGFNSYHHDPYTANIFAPETPALSGKEWLCTTMFEVWEHLLDPVAELEDIVRHSSIVMFTTEILPEPTPKPLDWWYYAPETGQHISFYTLRSLRFIAERYQMELATDGQRLHVLYRPGSVPIAAKKFLESGSRLAPVIAPLLRRIRKRTSLTGQDFEIRRRALRANIIEADQGRS